MLLDLLMGLKCYGAGTMHVVIPVLYIYIYTCRDEMQWFYAKLAQQESRTDKR